MIARTAAGAMLVLLCAGCSARQVRPASDVTLGEYIGKMRQLMTDARPRPETTGARPTTIEASDPALAAALTIAAAAPSARTYTDVGFAYMRHRVLDTAHAWFVRASRLDRISAASYDGQARVWREWGFPHLALPDAHRAVYFAPGSPEAHNTLGTVLQALGRTADARGAYERAIRLDANAAYAIANLCALTVHAGYTAGSVATCRDAVAAAPASAAARNNLALSYAAAGDFDAALRETAALRDPAARAYNTGVVLLLARRYADANRAFTDALQHRPSLSLARARAQQATRLAAGEGARP